MRHSPQTPSFVDSLVTWGIIPGMPDDSGLHAEDTDAFEWVPLEAVVELPLGDLVTRVLEVGREAEA